MQSWAALAATLCRQLGSGAGVGHWYEGEFAQSRGGPADNIVKTLTTATLLGIGDVARAAHGGGFGSL